MMTLRYTILLSLLAVMAKSDYWTSNNLINHCDKVYSLACFKLDAANWLDRFGVNTEFSVIPGVTFMQNPDSVKVITNDLAEEVAREFPNDESARANQFLIKKIASFLSDHSLKLNLYSLLNEADPEVTSRKDKKGSGGTGMILLAGAMMVGVLMALAMGGLTALAGKALLTAMVSFVLSSIIGLKQLTSGDKTYVAHQPVPVFTGSSHEGWEQFAQSRSGESVKIKSDFKQH